MLEQIANKLFVLGQENMLKNELKRLENQMLLTKKFPEYGTSEDENIQEVERIQENLSLQRNIKNLIKETKDALKRIEKDKYGLCETCGEQIEKGRLKVYPAASLCASCSKKLRK